MNTKLFAVLAALFLLTLGIAWQFPEPLDYVVYRAVRDIATPTGDFILDRLSDLGNGFVILLGASVLAVYGHRTQQPHLKRVALLCVAVYAIGGVLAQAMKHLLGRPRGVLAFDPNNHWGPSFERAFDAFPSGHATTAFGLAMLLCHFFPRFRTLFFSIAVLMAIVRVLRGSHWVTDVIAGAILGTMVGIWIASRERQTAAVPEKISPADRPES